MIMQLASLAHYHRLSPLCVGSIHITSNAVDLFQYDPVEQDVRHQNLLCGLDKLMFLLIFD